MSKKYNVNQLRATTLHLQDEILDELEDLGRCWYVDTKNIHGSKRVSMSGMIRSMLEVAIPLFESMDGVENEEDFKSRLSGLMGLTSHREPSDE